MKFSDMFLALLILSLFVAMFSISYFSNKLSKIKENWPEYRCNPMYMPLASQFGFDPVENFTYCIGSMQSNSMGFFMQPLHYLVSTMGSIGGDINESMNMVRHVVSYIRGSVGNIVGDIFGVFMNIIIQIQTMVIKIKDLAMKIVGVVTACIYIMGTSMKLGTSIWKGPIGGILRTICFKEDTFIKKEDGNLVKIKDLELGDTLENGAKVLGTLRLKGDEDNPYYKIWSKKLQCFIFVTGDHKILDKTDNTDLTDEFENYISVSDYISSIKTNIHDEILYCLITSNHRIPVGEYTFWDWED
jgi:hypothetical protein